MSPAANASRISCSARSQSAGSPSALSGLVANANRGSRPTQPYASRTSSRRAVDLVGELVRSDEQVRIVLDELADPGKPAERARSLVSMQPAEVAVTERQVAIGTQVRAVDECALRAVHRLEAEGLALGLDQEHVVAVQVPVARLPP